MCRRLCRYIHVAAPAGVLRTTNFVPGKIVDPVLATFRLINSFCLLFANCGHIVTG